MKEINYKGSLLDSTADIICHQVNPFAMGSGIAKQIRDNYPRVYQKHMEASKNGLIQLGTCQIIKTNPGQPDNRLVANLCGQDSYGNDGKRYTNYEGIYVSLEKLAKYCKDHNIKSVAFPKNMSCVRGGAKWWIIVSMIEAVFMDNENIIIEYWELNKS